MIRGTSRLVSPASVPFIQSPPKRPQPPVCRFTRGQIVSWARLASIAGRRLNDVSHARCIAGVPENPARDGRRRADRCSRRESSHRLKS
jgi:hypothetical protein